MGDQVCSSTQDGNQLLLLVGRRERRQGKGRRAGIGQDEMEAIPVDTGPVHASCIISVPACAEHSTDGVGERSCPRSSRCYADLLKGFGLGCTPCWGPLRYRWRLSETRDKCGGTCYGSQGYEYGVWTTRRPLSAGHAGSIVTGEWFGRQRIIRALRTF